MFQKLMLTSVNFQWKSYFINGSFKLQRNICFHFSLPFQISVLCGKLKYCMLQNSKIGRKPLFSPGENIATVARTVFHMRNCGKILLGFKTFFSKFWCNMYQYNKNYLLWNMNLNLSKLLRLEILFYDWTTTKLKV